MKSMLYSKKPKYYVGKVIKIPCFLSKKPTEQNHPGYVSFLLRHQFLRMILKKTIEPILVPFFSYKSMFNYIFVDGYIQRFIGFWIKRYIKGGKVLEIGIGSGKLIKYLDRSKSIYYGLDIFDVSPLASKYGNIHLFIASATDIPLTDSSMDYIISTEVLEHIKDMKRVIREIHRICKNKGLLLVSIPNNFSYKYVKKGPHPEHINNWSYKAFIEQLSPYFKLREGRMNGFWIPLFTSSKYSFQIPFSHMNEYYNSNFFYVFENVK